MKKKIIIGSICTLLILSAIIPTISIAQKENSITTQPLVEKLTVENTITPKSMQRQVKTVSPASYSSQLRADIPVAATESPEYHPAIAKDSTGSLLGAYVLESELSESNIIFPFSNDNGQTWDPGAYFELPGKDDYPAIEYWGKDATFYGTFRPDPIDAMGSAQYLFKATNPTDPNTWELIFWDWSSFGQRDKESPDIATYSDVGSSTWFYGVQVDTGSSDDPEATGEHIPILYFANYDDETSGWGWWWNQFEYSAHAAVDMDESNGYMYGVWDYDNASSPEQDRNILLGNADVHDWWAQNWTLNWYTIGDTGVNETYPDVGAIGSNIQIVAQSDAAGNQDIICYYSSNDGDTWSKSIVTDEAADEMYPRIVSYGEYATCTFVKDGDLYFCQTSDGGVSWSDAVKINDNAGTVPVDYRTNDITINGDTLWTDTRAGNRDIYFDEVGGEPPHPILQIQSISGGIGVSAVITNVGTGSATNVLWEINVIGGIFGRINKEVNGTIPSLAVGEEQTVKTGIIFGLGTITVSVSARCNEGDVTSEDRDGTQFIIITKVIV